MLSKIVGDICVTNDNIFKRSFSFVPLSAFWQQLVAAYNRLYFVQAVLHESSLLKENLTALKEEAEVIFCDVYILKAICEGERWPDWGANKRDTDVLWDQTSHWGAYQREPGNTLIS